MCDFNQIQTSNSDLNLWHSLFKPSEWGEVRSTLLWLTFRVCRHDGQSLSPWIDPKHFESYLSSQFLKSRFDLQRKMYIFPTSISICSVFRFLTKSWVSENPKFDTSIQNDPEGTPDREVRGECFAPFTTQLLITLCLSILYVIYVILRIFICWTCLYTPPIQQSI